MTLPAALLASSAPPVPPSVLAAPALRRRFDGPDLLRGLIMVVMLLDHTRDFTHYTAVQADPADLADPGLALFLTRWATHFCAPLFVLLAGMSAAFQQQRGKSAHELSVFLFKRGLWLIFLELTVIRFLIFWTVAPVFFFLQVIWALGVSMVCLALLVRLPRMLVLVIAAVMVTGHNLFDPVRVAEWAGPESAIPSAAGKLWMFLHQPGPFPIAGWPSPLFMTQYPLIPWIGVMALGWLLGDVYRLPDEVRRKALFRLGVAFTAAFVLLRCASVYGDARVWSVRPEWSGTLISFLNTTKYPPSLLFLLMTIGPGLVALSWFDRGGARSRPAVARALITFGRVPLFFYLLQWMYARSVGFGLSAIFHRDLTPFLSLPPWDWNERIGFGLPVTYAVWFAGVFALYPLCRWFAGVKARRTDWWLSYL